MLVIVGYGILFICLILLKCQDINNKKKENIIKFEANYVRYKTYSDVV
jgi:hypothetical protein